MPQDAERLLREAREMIVGDSLRRIIAENRDPASFGKMVVELIANIDAYLSSIESKPPAPPVQSEMPRPRDIEWLSPEVIKYVESLERRLRAAEEVREACAKVCDTVARMERRGDTALARSRARGAYECKRAIRVLDLSTVGGEEGK